MLYVGIAASLLIGVLLGLLGGGGSILTVPLLVYVLDVEPRTAIAMSLLVVGVTSASAAVVHARAGRVRWRTAFVFGAGGMAGAYLGGRAASLVPSTALLLLFSGVMVAAAVAMLRRKEAPPPPEGAPTTEPPLPVARVLAQGLGVGLLAGLVGAGGGFLIVPALVMVGLPMVPAVGTSLVVISLQCFAGLAGHLGHVDLPWGLTGAVVGTAVVGSFIGGRLLALLQPATVRKGFAGFVLTVAAFMVLKQAPAPLREQVGPLLARLGAWPWLAVGAVGLGLPLALRWRRLRPSGPERD